MGKILKYLKPFLFIIVFIISLLGIQAMSDLALPDYTAKIVNVGIQQSGIENPIPVVIREKEMNKLLTFLEQEDKDFVLSKYNLLSKEKDKDKLDEYNILAEENIYELATEDDGEIEKLSKVMPEALIMANGLDKAVSEGMIENIPEGIDIWTMIGGMPKDKLEELKMQIEEKIKEIDEASLKQGTISLISEEYKAIGLDTQKMQMTYIIEAGLKMLGIAAIGMIATIAVGFLGSRVSSAVGKNLRHDIFKKVISFSNNEFDKVSTASLITRSTNDTQQVQMFIMIIFKSMFYAPIVAIGGMIKVVQTDMSMAWIIGVGILGIMLVVAFLFKFAFPKSKIVQKLIDKLNLVTREDLTGVLVIRAFGTQKKEEEKFDKVNLELTKINTFLNRTMAMMMPLMMLIMNLLTIIIVWVSAGNIDSGTMQVGNMMAFIQYTMQIMMAFLMLSVLTVMLPRALVSVGRVSEVLNMESSIKNPKNPEIFKKDLEGVVEFRNVSFKYSNAEEYVLKDINFIAKAGQTTAFIGSTGSGKSTVINLIPRFFDVTDGEILVNGVNIKNVDVHVLREKIGYVPQKGVLFSGTIKSNIAYGKKDINEAEMKQAASIAQAIDFIEEKEKGFDSEIAQSGSNVSGGQKQRLSIARALAKEPNIYIFDDSFSALDLKTDAKLRKELEENLKDSTFLIVAQRISTIINADQIIVLDQGRLVNIGTHKELLKSCEVYRQIALSQLSEKEVSYE